VFGGGLWGMAAQRQLRHLHDEQPFANQFAILIGLQIGAIAGIIAFVYVPSLR
jgi:hypothetical protein